MALAGLAGLWPDPAAGGRRVATGERGHARRLCLALVFLTVVLLWGGLSTLWLPAFDHVMRYRETFLQLQPRLAQLQQQHQCVASYRFGEPQRAMLDYYDHFRTLRIETQPAAWDCQWLLFGSEDGDLPAMVTAHQLQPVQVVVRPGDARDRFMLFKLPDTVNALWPRDEIRRAVGK